MEKAKASGLDLK